MKTIKAYTYLLLGIVLSLVCACSEEVFSPATVEGKDVNLTLTYSDVYPREITVSRATEAEERKLDNLYIYIFDSNGNLKGFKEITDASKLDQETSSSKKAEIKDIKTKAGASYIYAVANVRNDGLYPIETSSDKVEDGKLPVGLDEDKAQGGFYTFTLDKLKALPFTRSANSIQMTSTFLMSGAVNGGKIVTINGNGSIDGNDNAIRLSRIVSKVKFTIKAKTETGVTRSFKLSSYDIINIALKGSLVGSIDGNTKTEITDAKSFSSITGLVRGVNDVEDGAEFFEVYLPENLQTAKDSVSTWNAREDDSQSTEKTFTNAPEYGTYVILKGRYEETSNGTTKSADVKYYVHLGDCSANVNDYNVERNCKYTFNITVAGVDKIIVEAEKKGNEQPGAEGVVLEYGSTGKSMILDSHYEYMVMRFYQNDIKQLKANSLGYYYQVHELGKHTDVINVTDKTPTGNKKNGVSTDWIQFAIKNGNTKSTYNSSATERGTACDYPGIQNIDKNTDGTGLYSIEMFLKLLYDKAELDKFWSSGSDTNGKYIDATCFVDENYYKDLTWDQYVNDVDLRKFYVANSVETSIDGRSVYAKAQYGLSQYNIQTFYDRSKSGSIVAYGCETVNDEDGKNHTGNNASEGTDRWNGRSNFVTDYKKKSENWNNYSNNKDLKYDCLSRNRDLNGDGKIDDNEVRWYVPTSAQYAGLWIGEDIISTEAKLFNKSTSIFKSYEFGADKYDGRMLYYTNTNGEYAYWSEEGMATSGTNSNTHYVRCVRNLKSNDKNGDGYKTEPNEYFIWDNKNKIMTLDKVDAEALNITGSTDELIAHTEREEANKPASKFYVASNNTPSNASPKQQDVVEGKYTCAKYTEGEKKWRVPNQREFCMMFIVAGNTGSDYYALSKNDLKNTYVRTYFSGAPFRKSWTCDETNLNMGKSNWDTKGYIRCISPVK